MSRRKNWPVIISDWKKSGLPVSQYCEKTGINRSNFFAWRKRLEKKEMDFGSFVPVKFSSEKKPVSLSIRIGDNIRIEVEDNFDTPQLVRAVEALGTI